LQRYLNEPVDYSVLVFIAPYEKIDERKKISKLLKKNAVTAACNPVKEYELNKWIKDLADNLKISITPLVFLHISTHFTATRGIPLSSSVLKSFSFQWQLVVKPQDFTSDLKDRLRALYAQ